MNLIATKAAVSTRPAMNMTPALAVRKLGLSTGKPHLRHFWAVSLMRALQRLQATSAKVSFRSSLLLRPTNSGQLSDPLRIAT